MEYITKAYNNYPYEIVKDIIQPMITNGKEAMSSTGDAFPIEAFSESPLFLTNYFKQKFAQVTLNPIDPIRERILMNMEIALKHVDVSLPTLPQPIISRTELSHLYELINRKFPVQFSKKYSTQFKSDMKDSLLTLVNDIFFDVLNNGTKIIIINDEDRRLCHIPMVMVIGCLTSLLTEYKLYDKVCIIASTQEVFDAHTAACLIGFGGSLIYPHGLYEFVENTDNDPEYDISNIENNMINTLNDGLLKIIAKSGNTSIEKYRNSRYFDILGLNDEIVNDCFSGAVKLFQKLGYNELESLLKSKQTVIGSHGKSRDSYRKNNYPGKAIQAIHRLSKTGKDSDYKQFRDSITRNAKRYLRDYFALKNDRKPIPLPQVEDLSAILMRFSTSAMSLGAISPEAHRCLAAAMNEMGGKSNSGEGGEDKKRYHTKYNSKIKQIAAGRFGITPEYLVSAQEIQIKISQGAKPGEGAQLPGVKVTEIIAQLRYTRPGMTLISPPAHHDLSTLQDLEDFIQNLKYLNPTAVISVKMGSTSGIGQIATDIIRAGADKIVISGGDGGTGAAPLGSIHFAGLPFEFGLREVQQKLLSAGLRNEAEIEVDGGLKTGIDVIKAAIMGADAFSFGTIALVSMGCKMCRSCYKNACTVGIATQNDQLRKNFSGTPTGVKNFFVNLAQDVREILSQLGYSSIADIRGRTDLLIPVSDNHSLQTFFSCTQRDSVYQKNNQRILPPYFEKEMAAYPDILSAINEQQTTATISLNNDNKSIGFITYIVGRIAQRYGNHGLSNSTIFFNVSLRKNKFLGSFLTPGLVIINEGDLGHSLGMGMCGGKIIVNDSKSSHCTATYGHSCLYGATGGSLFANATAGDRFAVRNSGANAVVNAIGDHGCEYMTGGNVVILGNTGGNFGAGMTGGAAFIYDETNTVLEKINTHFVTASPLSAGDKNSKIVYDLLESFVQETGATVAKQILVNYNLRCTHFWVVVPRTDV